MCILVVSGFNVLWGIMNFLENGGGGGGVYMGRVGLDMQMMLGLGDCELS